ncbi:MAG: hypothetical protein JNK45_25100 [Myxococcales bacterium]|nr:hypothetical protein [Myxococcales bacterium]
MLDDDPESEFRDEAAIEEAMRQRLLRLASIVAATIWAAFAVHGFALGWGAYGGVMLVCSFASGTSVVIARRAGSGMGGTYFSIVHLIGLTATSVCRGRLEPSVVLWCVILPLIAVLGGRPRKAVLWAVLSVVMVVGLAIAEPRGWLAAPVRQTTSGFMMSTVGLIVVVLVVGRFFDRHRVDSLARNARLQRELVHSQQLDALGRLAGGIAHDFNNLLSVILSRAELAIDGADVSDDRQSDLVAIREAGLQGAALTRDLLALASGSDCASLESLRPSSVVREVARLLGRVLPREIRLVTALEVRDAEVMASHRRLHQVLMNLCMNAKEAMPAGGTISVGVDNVTRQVTHRGAAQFVRIRVRDDGMGMSERTRARVLEPFFTTKSRGTGLGLATVHRIVREAGGVLEIESAPGAGATFDVYLPAVPESAMRQRSEARGSDARV